MADRLFTLEEALALLPAVRQMLIGDATLPSSAVCFTRYLAD
jgi:hypothetical protein